MSEIEYSSSPFLRASARDSSPGFAIRLQEAVDNGICPYYGALKAD